MSTDTETIYRDYKRVGCNCGCGKHCGNSCMTDDCDCNECHCPDCMKDVHNTSYNFNKNTHLRKRS
jgi:hypothetical protein